MNFKLKKKTKKQTNNFSAHQQGEAGRYADAKTVKPKVENV